MAVAETLPVLREVLLPLFEERVRLQAQKNEALAVVRSCIARELVLDAVLTSKGGTIARISDHAPQRPAPMIRPKPEEVFLPPPTRVGIGMADIKHAAEGMGLEVEDAPYTTGGDYGMDVETKTVQSILIS